MRFFSKILPADSLCSEVSGVMPFHRAPPRVPLIGVPTLASHMVSQPMGMAGLWGLAGAPLRRLSEERVAAPDAPVLAACVACSA